MPNLTLASTNPYQINTITKEYISELASRAMYICISKYINSMYIMPFLFTIFFLPLSPSVVCGPLFSVWKRSPHVLMYDFHRPCCRRLIVGGPLTEHFHLFTFLSCRRAIYAKIVHTVFLSVVFCKIMLIIYAWVSENWVNTSIISTLCRSSYRTVGFCEKCVRKYLDCMLSYHILPNDWDIFAL